VVALWGTLKPITPNALWLESKIFSLPEKGLTKMPESKTRKILNRIVDKVLAYKPKKDKPNAKNREKSSLCSEDKQRP